jgi:hypothetical protein
MGGSLPVAVGGMDTGLEAVVPERPRPTEGGGVGPVLPPAGWGRGLRDPRLGVCGTCWTGGC